MNLRLRVPATLSNMGPGFDCFGMALGLHLEVQARPAARLTITAEGAEVPLDSRNLIVRTFIEALGRGAPEPALALHLINRIPLARGLGSSAAARVAGLGLASAFRRGEPSIDREAVLRDAVRLEGHPDNATPAVFGGLCISAGEGGFERIQMNDRRLLVLVPDVEIHTETARRALPATYSREDAVFNLQRAALIAARVGRTSDLLSAAPFEDRLHQSYRLALEPRLERAFNAVSSHPAAAATFLSGSGPTVLCISEDPDALRSAATRAFADAGLGVAIQALAADNEGLRVESL